MPFIVPGGSSDVVSVNDKRGQVILDYRDVGAVANILDTCGGIQVGTTNERPSSTKDNVLYIMTDVTPNRIYRYSVDSGSWELIGGTGGSDGSAPTSVVAIDVSFNRAGSSLVSSDVQSVIIELNDLITQTEADLRSLIGNSGNGMIKLESGDVLGYLGDKIDTTLAIENKKLVVKSIDGLTVPVSDLNQVQGARSNLQAQIDSLTSMGNFTGTVNTESELSTIVDPSRNDIVIVLEDSTQGGASSSYMYNGTSWVYIGEFRVRLRDFTQDPIDLGTEVVGKLPSQNISDDVITTTDIPKDVANKISKDIDGKLTFDGEKVVTGSDIDIDTVGGITTDTSGDLAHNNNKIATEGNVDLSAIGKISEDSNGNMNYDGKPIVGGSSTGGGLWYDEDNAEF